nr:hypothetical protein [Candidatus Sigynarchaeota archaeon]
MSAELLSCTRVNPEDEYCAFTDLKAWNGFYWVAYRTGTGHVSPEGKISVCRSAMTRSCRAWHLGAPGPERVLLPRFRPNRTTEPVA